jgi:hypothetical protein
MSVVEELDGMIAEVQGEVLASEMWKAFSTEPDLRTGILRELFRDISCYQWFTTRAGFRMIGSLPASERRMMRVLLLHKWEEVEHREWAYACYQALGGQDPFLDSRDSKLSPAASSVAACWEWMADHLQPFAYLGAEYLFEKLTAELSKVATPILKDAGLGVATYSFISNHVEEDEKHAAVFSGLIREIESRVPGGADQIRRGFNTFRQVYPLRAWQDVFCRARRSLIDTVTPTK